MTPKTMAPIKTNAMQTIARFNARCPFMCEASLKVYAAKISRAIRFQKQNSSLHCTIDVSSMPYAFIMRKSAAVHTI